MALNAPADRSQLQQIVDGLSEGVILIEPDQRITYANQAALALHGVSRIEELGTTVDAYRSNFLPRYRDPDPPGGAHSPVERVVAGEAFRDVVVEVARAGTNWPDWTHRIRSLVITDADGLPDCLVLVISDETERYEAEERFDRAFAANPAPAAICRLADTRFVRANEGFLALTGFPREAVVGRSIHEVDVLRQAEQRDLAVERLHAGLTIPQMEARLRTAGGERWVVVAGQPIEMPGDERCMLFTFADLEDRRKAEAGWARSEERFAHAFQLAPLPMAFVGPEGASLDGINDAFAETFGYDGPDADGGPGASVRAVWQRLEAIPALAREMRKADRVRGIEARIADRAGVEHDYIVSAATIVIGEVRCALYALLDVTPRKRSEAELVEAIDAVMADASWFSRGVIERLASLRTAPLGPQRPGGLEQITAREREVLSHVGRGATDAEISRELGLSPNTVRNHVAALYRKLGLNRRSALVVFARERALDVKQPRAKQPRKAE